MEKAVLMSRTIIGLLVSLLGSSAVAQASPPGAEQYELMLTAMSEAQERVQSIIGILNDKSTDKDKVQAATEQLAEDRARIESLLDDAIKSGNAAALYMRARMTEASKPKDNNWAQMRESACVMYGEAAQKGLVAAAVAFVNCNDRFPRTPRYETSRTVLRAALNGQDIYTDAYPLPLTLANCFKKEAAPSDPDDSPLTKMMKALEPVMLDARQMRAEGFYVLAADKVYPMTSQAKIDLESAFAAGCENDPQVLKQRVLADQ